MELSKRISQSRIRIRSGLRLIAFLFAIVVLGVLMDVIWMAKLSGIFSVFFILVTLLECWNVYRLSKGQNENHNSPPDDPSV